MSHPTALIAEDEPLLAEGLRAREVPSGRLPLSEIAFEGSFHGPLVVPG